MSVYDTSLQKDESEKLFSKQKLQNFVLGGIKNYWFSLLDAGGSGSLVAQINEPGFVVDKRFLTAQGVLNSTDGSYRVNLLEGPADDKLQTAQELFQREFAKGQLEIGSKPSVVIYEAGQQDQDKSLARITLQAELKMVGNLGSQRAEFTNFQLVLDPESIQNVVQATINLWKKSKGESEGREGAVGEVEEVRADETQDQIDTTEAGDEKGAYVDGFPILQVLKEQDSSARQAGVYLVEKDGVKMVYKPVAEQVGLRALNSDKIEISAQTVPNREFSAYKVSEQFGFNLVPYTELTDTGSLQEFVANDQQKITEEHLQAVIPEDRLLEAATFIHLIGSRDTHFDNFLTDQNGRLWLIDNAYSFADTDHGFYNNAGLNGTVWGKKIPESVLGKLSNIVENENSITQSLSTLLSNQEIRAFFSRAQQLIDEPTIPDPYAR